MELDKKKPAGHCYDMLTKENKYRKLGFIDAASTSRTIYKRDTAGLDITCMVKPELDPQPTLTQPTLTQPDITETPITVGSKPAVKKRLPLINVTNTSTTQAKNNFFTIIQF
ncbi:hypothetical protein BpHYR1_031211 [Brachionus plicatilis]|uniref:Uncharacterized protein n=1 Tax=Brachionus plicatilis TaxID=10195 RepID=A0A3M7Q8K2_BRAPC|nr:hypothetical protein BpHYR1_031211 [Brachionus plicatilis]